MQRRERYRAQKVDISSLFVRILVRMAIFMFFPKRLVTKRLFAGLKDKGGGEDEGV
ncbi:hypothetical protein AALD01_03515 [Oscillospiraceae bacterium 21-37]